MTTKFAKIFCVVCFYMKMFWLEVLSFTDFDTASYFPHLLRCLGGTYSRVIQDSAGFWEITLVGFLNHSLCLVPAFLRTLLKHALTFSFMGSSGNRRSPHSSEYSIEKFISSFDLAVHLVLIFSWCVSIYT